MSLTVTPEITISITDLSGSIILYTSYTELEELSLKGLQEKVGRF